MEPKNHPIWKGKSSSKLQTIIFRFHVDLPGCMQYEFLWAHTNHWNILKKKWKPFQTSKMSKKQGMVGEAPIKAKRHHRKYLAPTKVHQPIDKWRQWFSNPLLLVDKICQILRERSPNRFASKTTLQGTNISDLRRKKFIFSLTLERGMLVPRKNIPPTSQNYTASNKIIQSKLEPRMRYGHSSWLKSSIS